MNMIKQKRKILAALLLMVVLVAMPLLSLVSCADNDNNDSGRQSAEAQPSDDTENEPDGPYVQKIRGNFII